MTGLGRIELQEVLSERMWTSEVEGIAAADVQSQRRL